jgi:hypothetical protein
MKNQIYVLDGRDYQNSAIFFLIQILLLTITKWPALTLKIIEVKLLTN